MQPEEKSDDKPCRGKYKRRLDSHGNSRRAGLFPETFLGFTVDALRTKS
jgi:hypothetical protein